MVWRQRTVRLDMYVRYEKQEDKFNFFKLRLRAA